MGRLSCGDPRILGAVTAQSWGRGQAEIHCTHTAATGTGSEGRGMQGENCGSVLAPAPCCHGPKIPASGTAPHLLAALLHLRSTVPVWPLADLQRDTGIMRQ